MNDMIHIEEGQFRGRSSVSIANDKVRVTLLRGGGHIAEITLLENDINPLWTPGWESIEPSKYQPDVHNKKYGGPAAGKLLASIMGHSICLDLFGEPSEEEAKQGYSTHGEAPVLDWDIKTKGKSVKCKVHLPLSNLAFTRTVTLDPGSAIVKISESVKNKNNHVHKFGWCQHVTLGRPFLKKGETIFNMPAVWGKTFTEDFGKFLRMTPEREFIWPTVPGKDGRNINLQIAPDEEISGDFSAQLMDDTHSQAYFTAYTPECSTLFGYVWTREDYPWIGNWEENYSRSNPPWAGNEYCRGMEFSTSPFPAGKEKAVEMEALHETPTFRAIDPGETAEVEYAAFISGSFNDFSGTDLLEYDGEIMTVESSSETYTIE